MDEYIIELLYEKQPEDSQAKIELLGKYDPSGIIIIKDPIFVRIIREILAVFDFDKLYSIFITHYL